MVGFSDILGRSFKDNKRQINRWKKIVSRFRGILVKTIRDAGSKFDDYSITPKIRQILLQQDYKLTEKTLTFNNIRLNKKQFISLKNLLN